MQFPSTLKKLTLAVALATSGAVLAIGALPPALATDATAPVRVEMTVPDFSTLVQQNAAAVVNITVTGKNTPTAAMRGMPGGDDESHPFGELFRQFPPRQAKVRGCRPRDWVPASSSPATVISLPIIMWWTGPKKSPSN